MKSKLFKIIALMAVFAMIFSFVYSPASAIPNQGTSVGQTFTSDDAPETDGSLRTATTLPAASDSIKESQTGLYIIRLADAPLANYMGETPGLEATSPVVTGADKLDVNTPASLAYQAYLEVQQNEFIAAAEQTLGRSVEIPYRYTSALNGLALRVSQQEAASLLALPGVVNVFADILREVDTDIGPLWIGADAYWNGDTGSGLSTQGEGIVIGVIDTGINHAHPSFADIGGDGYDHTNPLGAGVYLGDCNTIPGFCNDKLIGAYNFSNAPSVEDDHGHGSHTASTAAGNRHVVTVTVGVTTTIQGVAPHANIVVYRGLNTAGSGTTSGLVASVNQAVTDGIVDVLNYSISGSDDPWNDPVDLAFLGAFNAGIFVSASAGNNGPNPMTVAKAGPWNAAVAMSTVPRLYANSVDVTDPYTDTLQNMAALQGNGPALGSDLERVITYDPTNLTGCVAFPANYFDGMIGLVQRGDCSFAIKVANVTNAGGDGMVVFNNRGGPPISMSVGGTIPSVMLGLYDGLALADYIDDNAPVSVRLNAEISKVVNPEFADLIDSGSSRGPSQHEILKPDYAAPGVNILAAVAASGGDPLQYDFYSGTSMAAPHGAGAAALLIALNPGWSPAEVKSVLASTTTPWQTIRATTAADVVPANPFDTGSGRLNLSQAAYAGFVMNETYDNYVAANPDNGGKPNTLNQPSLVDYTCVGTCVWTRSLTSVLPFAATYTSTFVTNIPTLTITVEPASFTLPAGGTQVVTITADVTGLPIDIFAFGDVIFDTDAAFPPEIAAATILAENFDALAAPALPANWAYVPVYWPSGTEPRWYTNAGTHYPSGGGAVSAPNVAYFNSYSAADPKSARLYYTEAIDFSGVVSPTISFWLYHDTGYATSVDTVQVEVSIDMGTTWTGVGAAYSRYDGTTGWAQYSVDLSAYAGASSVMVGFLGISGFGNDVHIDDVALTGLLSMPVSNQHLTFAVNPTGAAVPDRASIVTQQKAGSIEISGFQVISDVTDLAYSVDGLSLGETAAEEISQDPTNSDPYNGDGGTVVITLSVPSGALTLLAEVIASEAPDVDLFVGSGLTPSAGTVLCTSASGIWQESCQLDAPLPGDYWVLAQSFSGSLDQPDLVVLAAGAVMPGDQGNLTVDDPGYVPAGDPFALTFNWDEPALVDGDRYLGFVTLGVDPAHPESIGTLLVTLDYKQPILIAKDAPDMAYEGDVIPYTIVLDGNGGSIGGSAWLTDTLPNGVEFAGGLSASSGMASFDAGDNAVYWNNAPIASGVRSGPSSASRAVALSLDAAPAGQGAASAVAPAPDAAVSLVLDDGTPENNIGIGGTWEFIYLNRFTPSAAEFPFALDQIQVYFDTSGLAQVGDELILAVYENTSGNTDPAVGSNLLATFPATVQAVDAWNVYDLATPIAFNGPGDVLIGVIALETPGTSYWPAAMDQTTTQQRSWAGWWLSSPPPTPPVLPPDDSWVLIDAYFPGNWLIRGYGDTIAPEVITITFNVTVTASAGDIVNLAEVDFNGETFMDDATTTVMADVSFTYNDLEDVVASGERVWIIGDFTDWLNNPIPMTANGDSSVFTALATIEGGSYTYKYYMPDLPDWSNYDMLNTGNRTLDTSVETMIDDYRSVNVGWSHLGDPVAVTITLGESSGDLVGEVYISNVTAPAGEGRGVAAQLGYGVAADPATWMWMDMTYTGDNGNNDLFAAAIIPAAGGVYTYGVRFDGNWAAGNPNMGWTYGDRSGVLTVLQGADLAITKTASADRVMIGGTFSYTLEVVNNGPSDATGVILTDTLPAGVTVVDLPAECTETAGVVVCDLGDIANGDSATVIVVVTAPGEAGTITNSAEVMANEPDPTTENNVAMVDVDIYGVKVYLPIVMKLFP